MMKLNLEDAKSWAKCPNVDINEVLIDNSGHVWTEDTFRIAESDDFYNSHHEEPFIIARVLTKQTVNDILSGYHLDNDEISEILSSLGFRDVF